MFYDCKMGHSTEARLQLVNQQILVLNEYCRRGLQQVDRANALWVQLSEQTDPALKMKLLDDGMSFLDEAIGVAREYARRLPNPNKLSAYLGSTHSAAPVSMMNSISVLVFGFLEEMEKMSGCCKSLRTQLQQELANKLTKQASPCTNCTRPVLLRS
jgi:hypothetical protein